MLKGRADAGRVDQDNAVAEDGRRERQLNARDFSLVVRIALFGHQPEQFAGDLHRFGRRQFPGAAVENITVIPGSGAQRIKVGTAVSGRTPVGNTGPPRRASEKCSYRA